MRRLPIIVALLAVAAGGAGWAMLHPRRPAPPAFDGPLVAVPSGMEVRYLDTVQGAPGPGLVYRFRFVAPGLTGAAAETAAADMQALCDGFALPRLPATGPQPRQVVIALADRVLPFGKAAPEAVQFFEAYRPQDGACVWELF
jgi:hypothetical protein